MKKLLHILRWFVSVTIVFTLLVAAVSTSQEVLLTDVIVKIDFAGEHYFVEQTELEEAIEDLGYTKAVSKMSDINPSKIEHQLENNAFIADAEVYKELNGKLHVDVVIRKPLVRVYNDFGMSAYIDEDGYLMPLSSKYTARTPIANGYINLALSSMIGQHVYNLETAEVHPQAWLLADIYDIAKETAEDEFWKAQCNQIYVTKDEELEIIPRVGDHAILLGTADDLDKKLRKLRLFYDEGLTKTGWNEYKSINLKYTNQVVCEKR